MGLYCYPLRSFLSRLIVFAGPPIGGSHTGHPSNKGSMFKIMPRICTRGRPILNTCSPKWENRLSSLLRDKPISTVTSQTARPNGKRGSVVPGGGGLGAGGGKEKNQKKQKKKLGNWLNKKKFT
jgi:hypothetical protein